MTPTYHIVSHSHWDREWYKTFEQFRSMLVWMVDDLLHLLDRDPAFSYFTLDGQTVVVDDYLAVRPEQEETLRRLIGSGRIQVGPWYVLPDEFLVSGEATVRNLLQGTRSARSMGGGMTIGYIPDSFGHIAMMPAILRGFGMENAVVYRGFGGEPGQNSSEYWWGSPDGSRCLMSHLYSNGYSAGYFHQESDAEIVGRFRGLKNELDARATTSHRLLLNGGDHHWPDPKLPVTLELLRGSFEGSYLHSTLPAYFDAVRKEIGALPEVAGEFRFGYRYAFAVMGGVYSSRMYIKQANWRCQNLLQRYVEPLLVIARSQGLPSQAPLVHHAWRTLMQNHPHDSICGCSIDPVHREMMVRFRAVEDIGRSLLDRALEAIVPGDDGAAGDDRHLVVFNPSPLRRSGLAEADVRFHLQDIVVGLNPDVVVGAKRPGAKGFALKDARGNEVPYQRLDRTEDYDISYTPYNYPRQSYAERHRVLIDMHAMPSMGIAGLTIERRPKFPQYSSSLKTGARFLENNHLRVEVNGRGEVTLHDKRSGRTYSGLNVFQDSGDVGDEYNYSYPRRDRVIRSRNAKVALVERGPLRGCLRVSTTMRIPVSATDDRKRRSTRMATLLIVSRLYLTHDGESLEFVTTVENSARDHRLRVLFPTGARTDRVFADSQFCIVERQQRTYKVKEFTIEHPAAVAPMQRFVAATDGRRGLLVLTDGLPEYELVLDRQRTIAVTLLRCVGLLAGEDLLTRPGGKAGWHNETPDAQCPGTHTFRYALVPLDGPWEGNLAMVNQASESFHLPFLVTRRKNGDLPPLRGSLFSMDNPRVVFSALKETEEGGGTAIRLYNPSPQEERVTLKFAAAIREANTARLDETALAPLEVRDPHELDVVLPHHAVVTVIVKTA